MISYDGFNEIIQQVYDENQDHVFENWDILNDEEKKILLEDLENIDFKLLNELYKNKESHEELSYGPAPYFAAPKTDEEKEKYSEAREAGIQHIKEGKTAAFVVAGGQGSRLGYDGPKGMYPVSPVKNKTLFEIHGEKILKYSQKYNVSIPWLIMTSNANHIDTVEFFRENKFFNIPEKDVFIFPQNMIPSLDSDGKIMLKDKNSIFKNPDGHGGSLTALHTSGVLDELEKRGVETISYFQIDNPLVKIIDPVFIGFHVLNDAEVSNKALIKAYPEEKIGVFVTFDNTRIGVVEYSDLPDDKAQEKDQSGSLLYGAGSIAIHLFDRNFVQRLTAGSEISLPFHIAKKKILSFKNGEEKEVDGYKFEKFVFDSLPLSKKNIIIETIREEEFAPVKNPSGVDSVESSQELMVDLHRNWLISRGVSVPEAVEIIEISPLYAVEAEDIDSSIKIPDEKKVYLD